MRTDAISFIASSPKRRDIVKTLFKYPKRLWSCSDLESITEIAHATVFRALRGLREAGVLTAQRINKRDMIYELVNSPLTREVKKLVCIEEIAAKKIAELFVKKIKPLKVTSIMLYGSAVKGTMKAQSDIDILVILEKHNREKEKKIYDKAAEISLKVNKTIAVMIMDRKEIKKEKNSQFIKSVENDKMMLYGKNPF